VKRLPQPVLVALCLALAFPTRAADWPQFRGPNRDGVSAETGLLRAWPPGGPKVLWSTPVGQGYAAAAIYGGRVYFNRRLLPAPAASPATKSHRT
jgi:outer membrane protein assembly factor BamB